MPNLINAKRLKNYFLLTIILGFTGFGSACASSDEDGAVSSNRECRTIKTVGSKMRQSICRSTEVWAIYDEREAEALAANEETKDEIFREALRQSGTIQGPGFDDASAFP